MGKSHNRCLIVSVVFAAIFVAVCHCEKITLFDYPDFEGSSFTLTLNGGGCYTLQSRWARRAASTEIPKGCFTVWDQPNCKGKNVKLNSGAETLRNLKSVDFDRTISSINLCSPVGDDGSTDSPPRNPDHRQWDTPSRDAPSRETQRSRSEKQIILYDHPNFEGSFFTLTLSGGCFTLQPRWARRAGSTDIQSGCFYVWDQPNCRGKKVKLTSGMEALRNLKRVDFDRSISSVNLCSPMEEEEASGTTTGSPTPGQKEPSTNAPGKRPSNQPSAISNNVQEVAIQEHNKYRKMHGVPPVQGNPEMHAEAQRFADHLVQTNTFETAKDIRYGQNLATSVLRNKADAVKDAVKRWYNNVRYYDFERPGYNVDGYQTGSFTAVIWRATTDIGVGVKWSDIQEEWIITVFYNPPAGRRRFSENVPPPVASA